MSTPPLSARADQLSAAVRPVFERAAIRDHVRGIAYGVVRDGALAHAGGIGWLRKGTARLPGPDSRSRICSMTKSFLAAAVLMLRDRGKLAGVLGRLRQLCGKALGLAGLDAMFVRL